MPVDMSKAELEEMGFRSMNERHHNVTIIPNPNVSFK
jgi:hypothetical protein